MVGGSYRGRSDLPPIVGVDDGGARIGGRSDLIDRISPKNVILYVFTEDEKVNELNIEERWENHSSSAVLMWVLKVVHRFSG